MKSFIAVGVFLFGVLLAMYLSFWYCTVLGIVNFVTALKHTPINTLQLAGGILRFILSGPVGWCTFMGFLGLAQIIENS